MQIKRTIAIVLTVSLLAQCLIGCGHKEQPQGKDIYIPEEVISEETVDSTKITEDNITQELIIENLECEDYNYELTINENFYCESYIIEVVVGENTIDEIRVQLPRDFDDYDIDWPKVIGKFAVGTSIIITVGIVHHLTGGSTYYFIASPAKVAKDAIVGGAMKAAIDVVLKASKKGELPYEAVKKYAIEGFADGYMWSAICSVGKTALANLKLPTKLTLKDGTILKILLDGTVVNKAGETVGKAYYSKEGIFIKNAAGDAIPYLFNSKGKQVIDIGTALLDTIAKNKFPPDTVLQVGLGESAKTMVTDSVGTVYKIDGKLIPNCAYQLGKNIYQTDAKGRIVKTAFDELALTKRKGRLPIKATLQEIARGFQKAGDDNSHLIGDRFDGDNTVANIVAMKKELNRGAYKAMEDEWARAIVNGDKVSGTIELVYSGESFRPDQIKVVYTIGEKTITKIFENL